MSEAVHVILFTRVGCHLCDVARQELEQVGLQPVEIDIDTDDDLRQQFDTCVPVVEINGRVRFRGLVNRVLLRRIVLQLTNESSS